MQSPFANSTFNEILFPSIRITIFEAILFFLFLSCICGASHKSFGKMTPFLKADILFFFKWADTVVKFKMRLASDTLIHVCLFTVKRAIFLRIDMVVAHSVRFQAFKTESILIN